MINAILGKINVLSKTSHVDLLTLILFFILAQRWRRSHLSIRRDAEKNNNLRYYRGWVPYDKLVLQISYENPSCHYFLVRLDSRQWLCTVTFLVPATHTTSIRFSVIDPLVLPTDSAEWLHDARKVFPWVKKSHSNS